MSRETLQGHDVRGATGQESVVVGLDLAAVDDQSAGPGATSGGGAQPSSRPSWHLTRTAVRAAVAAVVVTLVAGSAGALVERQRARAAADGEIRLLGTFDDDGAFGSSAAEGDGVGIRGTLHVVNAGAAAVDVVAAHVSGIAMRPLTRARRIEPGATGQLTAVVDLSCDEVIDGSLTVDVRPASVGGGQRRERRVELVPLRLTSALSVADALAIECGGMMEALVRVPRMQMEADGTVVVDLESASASDTRVEVRVPGDGGAQLDGALSAVVLVPADGTARLTVDVTVVDCAAARDVLTQPERFEVVEVSVRSVDGAPSGYADGWQTSVGTAAFGFAIARDCPAGEGGQ